MARGTAVISTDYYIHKDQELANTGRDQKMRNNYTLENFKRALRNPRLFVREARRLLSLPIHVLYGAYFDYTHRDGVQVMQEDWDNLIILDACRHDYFKDTNYMGGNLDKKISKGRKSWEFMQKNFAGRRFHDTVYVTANPFVTRLDDNTFYSVDSLNEYWDEDIGTILPENVTSAAIEANRRYPHKRLIIHFMQPHRPYLGETAEQLRERIDLVGYRNEGEGLQIWGAAKQGDVSVSEVRRAYTDSLNIVLSEVDRLLSEISGKSVITADHGEMLGEKILPFTSRVWGHSEGFSLPELRTVPYFTIEDGTRRDIKRDEPTSDDGLHEDIVTKRLDALGYKEET